MKETVSEPADRSSTAPDEPQLESANDRKRRLARERQRRHREKIRRLAAADAAAADATDRSVPSPARPQRPVQPAASREDTVRRARKSHHPSPPSADNNQTRRQGSAAAVAAAAGIAVNDRTRIQKPVVRASARAVRPDAQPPVPPRRSERHAAMAAAAAAAQANGMAESPARKRIRRVTQGQLTQQQQSQQQAVVVQQRNQHAQQQALLQQVQKEHQQKQLQKERQQKQQQQQQQEQENLQQQHGELQEQDAHTQQMQQRQRQLRGHQQQQQRKLQQQQQRHYSTHLLMNQHSATFAPQSHGFPTNPQPQSSQAHQQADPGFGFSTPADAGNVQTQFVAAPARTYLNDQTMSLAAQSARAIVRSSAQQRSERSQSMSAADAAAGLTALPGGVNGMHGGMASVPSSAAVPPGIAASPSAVGMTNAQGSRFSRAAAVGASTGQQAAGGQGESRDEVMAETYAHNPMESAEERKRRLARERQRRRRKRLKGESEAAKTSAEAAAREATAAAATMVNPGIHLPGTERTDTGLQAHGQSQVVVGGMTTPFEAGSFAAGLQTQSLQHMHVGGGANTSQEDLGAASGRTGFTAHTLGAGGVSAPNASAAGLVVPTSNIDLPRIPSTNTEVKETPVQYQETPEQRKRRLARERQRRRRSRLRKSKMGTDAAEKSPSSSQALKNTSDGVSGRIMENIDHRMSSEVDRRAMTSEAVGDPDRIPIGSPSSAVFGARGDVGQSLTFGDQQRGLRGNGTAVDGAVQGMGLNFGGNNGLNIPVHVAGIGNGAQTQGHIVHWNQGFESEAAARFTVESALSSFRGHISNLNAPQRAYVLQQVILVLSGSEELSSARDAINGIALSGLRGDGVLRM